MTESVVSFFSDCHGANEGYEGPLELVFEGGLRLHCVTVGGKPCVQQGDDVFTCSPTGSSPGAPGTGAAHQPGTPRMTSSEQGEVVFSLQFGSDDALYHYKLGRVLGQGAYGGVVSLEPTSSDAGAPRIALKISFDPPNSEREGGEGFNAVTAKHFLETEARFMHECTGDSKTSPVAAYMRPSSEGFHHTALFMPWIEGIAANSLMQNLLTTFPDFYDKPRASDFPEGVEKLPKGGSFLLHSLATHRAMGERSEYALLADLLWRFRVFYALTSGAIHHLHTTKSMVHGDMNLGNIMLCDSGSPYSMGLLTLSAAKYGALSLQIIYSKSSNLSNWTSIKSISAIF